MKNFKEIAEKIINKTISGTFILRNGDKVNSRYLKRYLTKYPYMLNGISYTADGMYCTGWSNAYDVIDFIPDTNMKENELTIEIPKGKIVDWDESKKQNKIVFRDKQLTYEDIIKNILEKHQYEYISPNGELFLTNHIHQCLEAKNKLTTVAKYLNGKWKPKSGDIVTGLVLEEEYNILFPTYGWCISQCLLPQFVFKSQELAKQAIEILGEKTVKLALEPLGV